MGLLIWFKVDIIIQHLENSNLPLCSVKHFLSETHAMGHTELMFLDMLCRTIDILPNENH